VQKAEREAVRVCLWARSLLFIAQAKESAL